MASKRRRLAERRKAIGLSQERLAEVMGVDRSTVARWERADTDPQPWHRPRLADALRISVEALADLLADTERALPRREPGRIDANDLDSFQSFRKADRQVGGGHLYATVTGYLQRKVAPRLFGHTPDSDDEPVFIAAAGLTEMAGWMAHDAGRDVLAEQHFQRALGMAQVGQDPHLVADICASLSHLAHHTKRHDLARVYARRGRAQLESGSPHPGLEARLLAMQARSHAADRDDDRCIEQLRTAERVLAAPPTTAPSPWASTFDEASLAAEAARCLRELGQFGAARGQAEQVVALRPPERIRSRAFAQLMLVSILIAQDRVDEACAIAQEALSQTRALGSMLVVKQFESLGHRLAPFAHHTDVTAFLAVLRDELRERRWLGQWLPTDTDQPRTGAS
jgi:transcriptional regulator with XRE-family HTH domain